jgi:hypothetical protein
LAPPLTGPFFIGKQLKNDLKDPGKKREVADGQVLVGIRIVKLKKRKENTERGAYERQKMFDPLDGSVLELFDIYPGRFCHR